MSWSADMENMESVMTVFDMLNGANEPRLADLVTPYRRFVRFDDFYLKEAPVSVAKKVYHRLFLFRDVAIVAKLQVNKLIPTAGLSASATTSSSSASSSGEGTGESTSFWRRLSFRRTSKTPKDNIAARVEAAQKSKAAAAAPASSGIPPLPDAIPQISKVAALNAAATKGKVVLSHYLPLEKCTFRSVANPDDDGMHGVQVTFVQRIQVQGPNNEQQINTKVEKFEFWFDRVDARDALVNVAEEYASSLRDEKKKDESSTGTNGASANGAAGTKGRKWTASKGRKSFEPSLAAANSADTLRQAAEEAEAAARTLDPPSHSKGVVASSTSSAAKASDDVDEVPDIEAKYNIKFTPEMAASPEGKSHRSVEYPEGPMGLSLGSGDGIGVIVVKVSPDSISEMGGVYIGDRVTDIGDKELGLNTSWQSALEIIKSMERPLTVKFERNDPIYSRIVEAITKTEVEEPGNAPRRWSSKRGTRVKSMATLKDLEKLYDDETSESKDNVEERASEVLAAIAASASTAEEKQCINVMRELLSTEKDYVNGLLVTVGEFIIPLRRAMTRVVCKDDLEGSRICEHNLPRSSCSKESKVTKPLCKSEDIKELFMNTETLMKINSELYTALNKGVADAAKSKPKMTVTEAIEAIVPTFVKVLPFFNMYALYCHQYPNATSKLRHLRLEKEYDDFFQKRETSAAGAMAIETNAKVVTINSLLIKPVQRICKYPLLFTELLKGMRSMIEKWKETGELATKMSKNLATVLENLEAANIQVQRIADDVNQKVQTQDAINSVVEIYEELGGGKDGNLEDLFVPSRRFLGSYEVYAKLSHESASEPALHKLYLFNDWIILALPRFKNATKLVTTRKKSMSVDKRSNASSSAPSPSLLALGMTLGKDPLKWTKVYGIDLRQSETRLIAEKDKQDWYGFQMKFVDRQVHEDKGTSKIITHIHKFDIWVPSEPECSELQKRINDNIDTLDQQREGDEKGKEMFGGADINKKRSWKKKSTRDLHRHANSFSASVGGSVGGEDDTETAQAALSDIAQRYVKDN